MNKQLSIQQASRFIIGAAMIREMAMAATPNATITSDHIAAAALSNTPEGAELRASIAKLAERETKWMRNTPPHVLATPNVMATRTLEIAALNSIQQAQMTTLEFGMQAIAGDSVAIANVHQALKASVRDIHETKTASAEKRSMLSMVLENTINAVGIEHEDFAIFSMGNAQDAFLKELHQRQMELYRAPDKSSDLDLGPN